MDVIGDLEVDLLIAGAGPAGMTAALVASLEGLDVLLCEKSDRWHRIDVGRHAVDSGQ
jgi:flavin-dependent dehydrogenase